MQKAAYALNRFSNRQDKQIIQESSTVNVHANGSSEKSARSFPGILQSIIVYPIQMGMMCHHLLKLNCNDYFFSSHFCFKEIESSDAMFHQVCSICANN